MSVRSLILLSAIVINVFDAEFSHYFYSLFFIISGAVALFELLDVLKLKMIKKKEKEEIDGVVIDIEKIRKDLEEKEKKKKSIIQSW
jgi:hypothetical protein